LVRCDKRNKADKTTIGYEERFNVFLCRSSTCLNHNSLTEAHTAQSFGLFPGCAEWMPGTESHSNEGQMKQVFFTLFQQVGVNDLSPLEQFHDCGANSLLFCSTREAGHSKARWKQKDTTSCLDTSQDQNKCPGRSRRG
jgi:hypothetical protein